MNNLLDILNKSVNYLEKKNIKNARLTAESIISEVMEMERIMLYAEFERILSEDELKKIREKLNDVINNDKKISDNNDFENMEKSEKQLKLLLDKSILYLEKNSIDESKLIAEIIFSHVLNVDRMMLFTKYRNEIEDEKIEKIRTYNFPQGRVTDHRIKLTLHRLEGVLDGDLDEMIDALIAYEQAELLKEVGSSNE